MELSKETREVEGVLNEVRSEVGNEVNHEVKRKTNEVKGVFSEGRGESKE